MKNASIDPISKFYAEIGKSMREKLDEQILGRPLMLQERKFQATMKYLNKIRPIRELSLIYRALQGDEFAQRFVIVREVMLYHNDIDYYYDAAMTFYEFVRANHLPLYEEVLRS